MFFRPFSYFCVCARLFSAVYLPKQKLKIWPFRAIIESFLPFNLLTCSFSHLISCKNPFYFSQFFYVPLCLTTLLSFLASFLPWLIPFGPFGFVAPQKHGQISVQHRILAGKKLKVVAERRQHSWKDGIEIQEC